MPRIVSAPLTVAGLLDDLAAYGPTVEARELSFERDPPAELLPVLRVLHTGVRAVLTGRRWWGCGSTAKTARPVELGTGEPIPPGITLLCVEGDTRWDRIGQTARIDLPRLFAPVG